MIILMVLAIIVMKHDDDQRNYTVGDDSGNYTGKDDDHTGDDAGDYEVIMMVNIQVMKVVTTQVVMMLMSLQRR